MRENILKTIILIGPTILSIELLLNGIHSHPSIIGLGLVAFFICIYFLLSIWKKYIILKIPSFLRGILLLLSSPLWFGFCGISLIALISILPEEEGSGYGTRCSACDNGYILPIVSENNVVLDLIKGKELKKNDISGWQSCGCRKVVSFENNPDYALEQISLMDNYWTEHDDCQDFLKPYSAYAKQVNFNASGSCYTHVQTSKAEWKSTEIVIVYDKKTNHLFYHFYRP